MESEENLIGMTSNAITGHTHEDPQLMEEACKLKVSLYKC